MKLFIPIFLLASSAVFAQTAVPELKATEIRPLDLSDEHAKKFKADQEKFAAISEKLGLRYPLKSFSVMLSISEKGMGLEYRNTLQ
jgi:hypothetical protein